MITRSLLSKIDQHYDVIYLPGIASDSIATGLRQHKHYLCVNFYLPRPIAKCTI